MTDGDAQTPGYLEYEILDAARTVKIYGTRLAVFSTEKPDLVRWTTLALYRYRPADQSAPEGVVRYLPEERYLFHVVARSLVYHDAHTRPDGTLASRCGKGVATSAAALPGYGADPGEYDAQACPDCSPAQLDDLERDAVVFMEKDWPRVEVCADPAEVRRKLAEHNPKNRPGSGEHPALNHPSQRLLEEAALVDPAFGADRMVDRL